MNQLFQLTIHLGVILISYTYYPRIGYIQVNYTVLKAWSNLMGQCFEVKLKSALY